MNTIGVEVIIRYAITKIISSSFKDFMKYRQSRMQKYTMRVLLDTFNLNVIRAFQSNNSINISIFGETKTDIWSALLCNSVYELLKDELNKFYKTADSLLKELSDAKNWLQTSKFAKACITAEDKVSEEYLQQITSTI